MPKNKTHKGTAKRVRVTGKGKLRRQRVGRRHLMESKPTKLTRRLEGTTDVDASDVPRVKRLLGR